MRKEWRNILILLIVFCIVRVNSMGAQTAYRNVWEDPSKPLDERIKGLISKMTLEEKTAMLRHNNPEIKRLNVPEYDWWNECLHGVARNGNATIFPQSVGLASAFDKVLMYKIGTVISDEARAKYNEAIKIDNRGRYAGLTFWTPNINIYRDPRWGRGQETYGEDPVLTGTLGTMLVKGLQGDNSNYLKVAACAKHYAVHSGPESSRHEFNAVPGKKDFFETYAPAFKTLVQEAKVEAVMCAYNRTFGQPCCGSPYLLQDILRKKWGFKGHVVSDCWAIMDFNSGHHVTKNEVESAALAINSGVNLNCGVEYKNLVEAVRQHLVKEETIDILLYDLLKTRFRLGFFDPPELNPYNRLSKDIIDCENHRKLALEAATKSMVLLKNNGVLPLKTNIKRVYVTGPNATNMEVLLGNYHGVNSRMVTFLEGITNNVEAGITVGYMQGILLDRENATKSTWTARELHTADAIVLVMGVSGLLEGEEGDALASGKGDREDYQLPQNQVEYLKEIKKAGNKPIVLVLTGGSPVQMDQVKDFADAIIWVWYPGEEGGNALGRLLFGKSNPSGRLPVTFVKSYSQLPAFENYSMEGRTYRYMKQEPEFPFGFGLSYTNFEYSNLKLNKTSIEKGDSIQAEVTVKNAGNMEGDEVIQFYLTDMEAGCRTPNYALKGFDRISLKPDEKKTVVFTVTPKMMELVLENGESVIESGKFKFYAGGCSPSLLNKTLGLSLPIEAAFEVK